MINIVDVHKSYDSLEVLRGVNLTIAAGEVVAITGASGAGKSTLLHIIGSLMSCERGDIFIDSKNISQMKDSELSRFRNEKIGFVFQFHNLLPEFTAFENICLPGYIGSRPKSEVENYAQELLALMGLSDRATHKPTQLSGGEQQRIAIARALINSPQLLLADEPSGNLDSVNREEIHRLFFKLRDKLGITVVVVTHDEELANMSDRKIVMRDGEVVRD
ncbi:MAG: ABC transporter ATP-binding protein [Rikenellaceae bacterium]